MFPPSIATTVSKSVSEITGLVVPVPTLNLDGASKSGLLLKVRLRIIFNKSVVITYPVIVFYMGFYFKCLLYRLLIIRNNEFGYCITFSFSCPF